MGNLLNKISIPAFFKTKKFIIIAFLLFLVFFFTPISLRHIGQKAEKFIHNKIVLGVQRFEQQTGLQIEWGSLDFNIFMMTVALEDVQVLYLKQPSQKRIEELEFLSGLQKIKKISARPSFYSFLFKKKIVLSKLNIKDGAVFLKTVKKFKPKARDSKNRQLPIKKISIKNTDVILYHKNYSLKFSDIQSEILQKSGRMFDFNFKVDSFYFRKDLGFEGFFNTRLGKTDKDQSYQLSMRGAVQKNKVSFSQIILKNESFSSLTQSFSVSFDKGRLSRLEIQSSGSLPFSLIQEGFFFMNKSFPFSGSNLSYDLDLQYSKKKGYRGPFSLSSKDFIFRSEKIKSLELKGSLNNKFLFINKGSLYSESKGDVYVKSAELGILEPALPFNIALEMDQMSSNLITHTVLNSGLPIQADLTAFASCQGSGKQMDYLRCELKGKSQNLKLQPEKQPPILSFYNMDFNFALVWKGQTAEFELEGKKGESSLFNFSGQYLQKSHSFSAEYSFSGDLGSDLHFHTSFPLKGPVSISNGKIFIKNEKVHTLGRLSSGSLDIDSYQLKNISSSYRLKNNKLEFFNIRGQPGQTRYSAELSLNFQKQSAFIRLDSSFFDIQDFLIAVKKKKSFPISFKGSGSLSVFYNWTWGSQAQTEFQFKGDFFNVFIDQDFFSQSTFDIKFKNQKGIVQSLLFRKGQGLIKGSGFFDKDYKLNLAMKGTKLSLEELEFLNQVLSLNQAGDIDFNLDIKGSLSEPDITGSAFVSNTFLYSYSVKDSSLQFKMNKDSFSFSGNIIGEIEVDQFRYPFFKNSKLKIKGRFYDLDFIKILLSKSKKDVFQNYSSQLKGSFNVERVNRSFWKGSAVIEDIVISKSDQLLKNNQAFSISLKEDSWSLSDSVTFSDNRGKKIQLKKTKPEQLLLKGSASLSFFSALVPFFEEFDGNINGQVIVQNNFKRLEPKGSLQIEKGLLTIYPLPSFTNISAQLVFSKDNVIINNFNSGAGGGQVQGMGSVFYNFSQSPVLDLNLSFDKAHFQIPEGFNTKGKGKIKIKGSAPPYLISGEYNIDSGSIVREFSAPTNKSYDFSLLTEGEKKKKSLFELSLKLKTERAVSINSSLIRSFVEGSADIYGPFDSLLIKGAFRLPKDLKQSVIFFRGQEFKISSGSILFENSAPNKPYLDILADTVFKEQVIDPLESQEKIEKQYKIFLSVKGRSQNLKFSLKSAPALNEREIISLLALGVDSRRFDTNVKQNITDYSYQILTSFLIEKPLNKEIKETLGLDFRLTPYIDTSNKPVTKITLSKSWLEKWRTSFSRTIEESAQSDLRLKYDLNNKVSLTAFWENKGQIEFQEDEEDSLGLNLEFNFDF